jgi:hypothetical protein
MTQIIWTGTTSNDWNTTTNWTPNQIPADGDDVIFRNSQQSVLSGLNQSAVRLNSLSVSDTFSGDIGTAANYLQVQADDVFYRGTGNLYLDEALSEDPYVAGSLSHTGSGACTLKGEFFLLELYSGTTVLTSTSSEAYTQISELWVERNAALRISESGSHVTVDELNMVSGNCAQYAGTITAATVRSGQFACWDGTLTTVTNYGGSVAWSTEQELATALIVGGTFDASGDQRTKTITSLEVHSAGTVNLDNGANSIVVTNPIANFGGYVTHDPNATFTIA